MAETLFKSEPPKLVTQPLSQDQFEAVLQHPAFKALDTVEERLAMLERLFPPMFEGEARQAARDRLYPLLHEDLYGFPATPEEVQGEAMDEALKALGHATLTAGLTAAPGLMAARGVPYLAPLAAKAFPGARTLLSALEAGAGYGSEKLSQLVGLSEPSPGITGLPAEQEAAILPLAARGLTGALSRTTRAAARLTPGSSIARAEEARLALLKKTGDAMMSGAEVQQIFGRAWALARNEKVDLRPLRRFQKSLKKDSALHALVSRVFHDPTVEEITEFGLKPGTRTITTQVPTVVPGQPYQVTLPGPTGPVTHTVTGPSTTVMQPTRQRVAVGRVVYKIPLTQAIAEVQELNALLAKGHPNIYSKRVVLPGEKKLIRMRSIYYDEVINPARFSPEVKAAMQEWKHNQSWKTVEDTLEMFSAPVGGVWGTSVDKALRRVVLMHKHDSLFRGGFRPGEFEDLAETLDNLAKYARASEGIGNVVLFSGVGGVLAGAGKTGTASGHIIGAAAGAVIPRMMTELFIQHPVARRMLVAATKAGQGTVSTDALIAILQFGRTYQGSGELEIEEAP